MTFYVADRSTRGIEPGDVYAYPDGDRDESLIAWAESMGMPCMGYARTSVMDQKAKGRHVVWRSSDDRWVVEVLK